MTEPEHLHKLAAVACDNVRLYLDCAASAPVFPELQQILCPYANPSSGHRLGLEAAALLRAQRARCAQLLDCEGDQIIFCSGATEANNLALYNKLLPKLWRSHTVAASYSELEHPSCVQVLRQLTSFGLKLRQIPLSPTGELLLGRHLQKYQPNLCVVTGLDSESGRKQDLAALVLAIQNFGQGAYIHADLSQYIVAEATQLFGLGSLLRHAFDSITISGQKIGAGRGGAILLQRKMPPWNFSQGGRQEGGQRAGTENMRAICALVRALELQAQQHEQQLQRSKKFLELLAEYPAVRLQPSYRNSELFSPFIFSVAVPPLPAEVAQRLLSERGYMVGIGSACSGNASKSHSKKLRAQGYECELLPYILRISFGNGASYPSGEQLRHFFNCLHKMLQNF